MRVDHGKILTRAERLAERWRRALACHGQEIAKEEIYFYLIYLQKAIAKSYICFPELNQEEHLQLYPVLLQMKASVFNCKKKSKTKKVISFRLTEEARHKLEYLAEKGGVSRTAVIENLLMAQKRFKIAVPEAK